MYILVLEMASDLDPAMDGHLLLGEKFSLPLPPEFKRKPMRERLETSSPEEDKEVS